MVGTQSPAGLYLMRWVQASSGHQMPCLESNEGPKPSSMPTGHNPGLLSKVSSALGSPEAMQQYAKIPRKKHQVFQEIWQTLNFQILGFTIHQTVFVQTG